MIGITGGTGFLGNRVVTEFAGISSVRVLALQGCHASASNIEYLHGDICDDGCVNSFVRGCDAIIHLAGIAHSELRTEAEKQNAHLVNVQGTASIVRAALRSGVRRLAFISTAHVYSRLQGLSIDETAPVGITTVYAKTKIEAENIVREAGQQGLEVVILRPCLIYGPGVRFNLARMLKGIYRGYFFHIADYNPMRSFLSLDNAAKAIRYLLASGQAGETYNVADEQPYLLADFANELADRMKRPRPRTLPSVLVKSAGGIGSMFHNWGIHLPISKDAIHKLTSDFTLSTRKLANAGFSWTDGGKTRQDMVEQFLLKLPHT